jgi:L-aminopeptidase/D-esterase-like protein
VRFVSVALAAAALFCISVASAVAATGPNNAITDVPGVEVGHSTRLNALTGTTALIFRQGALMGFAPSGGAPGDRLSALLTSTHQDSQRVVFHGLTLSGGSIYGLDTACGVVKYLREQGLGYGEPKRPYVPGAIIFDLGRGPINAPPGRSTPTNPYVCSDGYIAATNAKGGVPDQGSVGGGTGASAGGLRSGFGTASVQLPNGIVVGAAVVVNSGGGVYNTVDMTCELYALWLEDSDEFKDVRAPTNGCTQGTTSLPPLIPGQNTTIGVIATNAPLTAGQAQRMAIIAGDGMARGIRPAHGNGDGDTVFGVVVNGDASTVQQSTYVTSNPSLSNIYNAGADAYSRAIGRARRDANPARTGPTNCHP